MDPILKVNGTGYINIEYYGGLIVHLVIVTVRKDPSMDWYVAELVEELWDVLDQTDKNAIKLLISGFLRDGGRPIHLERILSL